VLESTLDDARAKLTTNYLGIVSMTQEFAPVLAANGGGAFVNVLSIFSWIAVPSLAIYAASKAAAWSYTNAARVQLAQQGTHVVGVFVQYVDTDLIAGLDVPKVAPRVVAAQALDAAASGAPEAIIDEASRDAKAGLSDDQNLIYPEVRRQFDAAHV
jgi:short-subunit dehydrogenase